MKLGPVQVKAKPILMVTEFYNLDPVAPGPYQSLSLA